MRKNLFTSFMLSGLIAFVFFQGCKKEEEKPEMEDIYVVDISQETDWDYWVVGKNGDYFYLKEQYSKPSVVLFHSSKSNESYPVFLDESGFPDKVIIDNYIFLFDNFQGNKVDIAVILPDGNIEITREVETEINWNELNLKSANAISAWSDVIRWTGRVVGGIPCALSLGATVASSGAGWPLAAWICGNYFLGLAADISDEHEMFDGFVEIVETWENVQTPYEIFECAGDFGVSCVTNLASAGLSGLADYVEELEERSDDVQVADAVLYAGHGDVQITLTWNNTSDLDLHVIDPNGEEIWWNDKYAQSDGILDYDDIDGYGPENIYWPNSQAPNGTYQVYIHDYVWQNEPWRPTSANYTVLITAFDNVKKFTGSISLDEIVHITDFDQNSLKSATITNDSVISILKSKKK